MHSWFRQYPLVRVRRPLNPLMAIAEQACEFHSTSPASCGYNFGNYSGLIPFSKMELLLNILWLLLALPALVVWRHQARSSRNPGEHSHARSFVLSGCLLALLFPVISASDDLHPIRAEIEEAGISKRTVKYLPSVTSPAWSHDGGGAARLPHLPSLQPENDTFGTISEYLPIFPQLSSARISGGRAPPTA
jgi:hypothetical protein